MREIRVNLDEYGGLIAMVSLTAPGEDAGLVWDRSLCRHPAGERCDGKQKGCKVDTRASAVERAVAGLVEPAEPRGEAAVDRATKRRGARTKGGFRTYDWELQGRDVWHLHIVLGMETPIERAWAFEYVRALRELGARCGYGWVDAKPGSLEVSVTVKSARRTLLTYVSRKLTARPVGGGSPGRPHGRRRGPPPRGGRRRAGATR
jgi:hypothetical protein